MTTRSHHSFRLSQTHLLLAGLSIGYVSFVSWLGMRSIVLLSGAAIAGTAIVSWYRQPRKAAPSTANLLQADVFLNQVCCLDDRIPEASQTLWRSVKQQAEAIQQIAAPLAHQEPAFIPDLLETLHTVLDLAEQLAQALQVKQQVQTPRYRKLAQQQLQNSLDRLQQTHDQLQELRDQIALGSLERRSLNASTVISTRLQTLIAENESGILGD